MKKTIELQKKIIKTLKERGRFSSPEAVQDFFEESLDEVAKQTIQDIAIEDGWEDEFESEWTESDMNKTDFYLHYYENSKN